MSWKLLRVLDLVGLCLFCFVTFHQPYQFFMCSRSRKAESVLEKRKGYWVVVLWVFPLWLPLPFAVYFYGTVHEIYQDDSWGTRFHFTPSAPERSVVLPLLIPRPRVAVCDYKALKCMTPLKYILVHYMHRVQTLKNNLSSAVIVHGQEMPSKE